MDAFYYLNLFFNNIIVRGTLLILLSIILAYLVDYLIWYYIKRITIRTNTNIDDFLVNVLTTPIHWLVIILFSKQALLMILKYRYIQEIDWSYKIILIFLIACVISKLLAFFIGHWLKVHKRAQKIPQYVSNIVAVGIFLIAVTIILIMFKISVIPLITSFGIAGLAIGLALQNTLVNFIAGIKIIAEEKVKIGDYIDGGEELKGVVEDMSLNSTRIRNLNNNIIIVPNSKISDGSIINYARNDTKIRLVVPVTLIANKPIDQIKDKLTRITYEVFNSQEGVYKKRNPEVWLLSAEQPNSMLSPILRFNILINVISYRYEFSVMDAILVRVSREFWDNKEIKPGKKQDID